MPCPALAGEEIAAVGRGQEILRAPLDDPQALLGEPQVADDLRIEQAHSVGRDRVAEARMKLLRDRGAADHLAALDDAHAQARHREIGRAGEAVMASADDDDVGFAHEGFKNVPWSFRDGPKDQTRNDICISGISSPQHHETLYCPFSAPCAPLRASGARRGVSRSFHGFDRATRRHGAAVLVAQPAAADGLHRRDLRQCAAAVLGAAAVHQDGAAAARRLAGGVVGGDGVLPVAAARRATPMRIS